MTTAVIAMNVIVIDAPTTDRNLLHFEPNLCPKKRKLRLLVVVQLMSPKQESVLMTRTKGRRPESQSDTGEGARAAETETTALPLTKPRDDEAETVSAIAIVGGTIIAVRRTRPQSTIRPTHRSHLLLLIRPAGHEQ